MIFLQAFYNNISPVFLKVFLLSWGLNKKPSAIRHWAGLNLIVFGIKYWLNFQFNFLCIFSDQINNKPKK